MFDLLISKESRSKIPDFKLKFQLLQQAVIFSFFFLWFDSLKEET